MKKLTQNSLAIFLFIGIFSIAFHSCKDDDTSTQLPLDPVEDVVWDLINPITSTNNYLKANAEAPISMTYNPATTPSTVLEQNGIKVTLYSNTFANKDGRNYEGIVDIKLYSINKVNQMVYQRASTIADNGELLISGGMFKLDAKDSLGNDLTVRSSSSYNAEFETPFDPNNLVFRGSRDANGQLVWEEWDSLGVQGRQSTLIAGLKDFDWCNLDRYMNETPLTDLTIELPVGFTNTNSEVIMRYSGEFSSALLPANPTLKKFSTQGSGYRVVQGRGVKILALCIKNSKYYVATLDITAITANHNASITAMNEVSETDFNSAINNF